MLDSRVDALEGIVQTPIANYKNGSSVRLRECDSNRCGSAAAQTVAGGGEVGLSFDYRRIRNQGGF
jgi:hypothetical protein